MVRLTNTPIEGYGCRMILDSSSSIYMTAVNEAWFCIVVKNMRKKDEVKTMQNDLIL